MSPPPLKVLLFLRIRTLTVRVYECETRCILPRPEAAFPAKVPAEILPMIQIGIVGCGRIMAARLAATGSCEVGVDDFRITALCSLSEDEACMYLAEAKGRRSGRR